MLRLHKILLVIIVLEAIELAVLGYARVNRPRLPLVNHGMLDPLTAEDIKRAEGQLDAGNSQRWSEMADVYRLYGYYPQAEYCYARIDSLPPTSSDHVYFWAICRERMGWLTEANQLYHRAISTNSDYLPFCWLHIGMNHLRLEEIESAEKALRKALRIPEAKMLLSRLLIRTGRANQALPLLDELSQQFPDAHDVDLMKSYASSEQGNHRAARRLQEMALRHANTIPTGSGPESITWVDADGAVRSHLDHYGWRRRLREARKLDLNGQTDEAIRILEEVLESRWTLPAVVLLADLYQQLNRPRTAIELLAETVERVGTTPQMLERLADAHAVAGQAKEALDLWEKAAQWQPTSERHQKMARTYTRRGDLALASRHQGLQLFHGGVDSFQLDRLEEAQLALEQAVSTMSDHTSAWFYLAETRRFLDRSDRAKHAYTRCLELQPNHGRALRGLRQLSAPTVE